MKIRRYLFAVFTAAAFGAAFFSCASTAETVRLPPGEEEAAGGLLPLKTGWYQYDFERTFKGIEDEYNFNLSTGMKMVEEITYRYTGVVCRVQDRALYEPVMGIELLTDDEGRISCAENPSIRGTLEDDGRFFWTGSREENGRLNSVFVNGRLSPLSAAERGGPEFDGVYHLTDAGTGREQMVRISGGFYTWQYIDGEEAGFTPWPTLIRSDGSLSFGLEMTTVMEMGTFGGTNYSTGFTLSGKVIPGQGIFLEELSHTTGLGASQGGSPQAYAGTTIRSGEYPNEAIPPDIESLLRSGRAAVQAAPKPDPARYPPWYLKLPAKPGAVFGAGEKTFPVRETALAMAEAAAAAHIAEQLRVRIEERIEESSRGRETRIDSRIRSEALERLSYRVVEKVYQEETRTAFVLAELIAD